MPAAKAMGAAKKAAVKVDHKGRVFTYVLAQMASAAPPLGKRRDCKYYYDDLGLADRCLSFRFAAWGNWNQHSSLYQRL